MLAYSQEGKEQGKKKTKKKARGATYGTVVKLQRIPSKKGGKKKNDPPNMRYAKHKNNGDINRT